LEQRYCLSLWPVAVVVEAVQASTTAMTRGHMTTTIVPGFITTTITIDPIDPTDPIGRYTSPADQADRQYNRCQDRDPGRNRGGARKNRPSGESDMFNSPLKIGAERVNIQTATAGITGIKSQFPVLQR